MHVTHHIKRSLWAGMLILALLPPALVGCDSKQPSEEVKQESSKAVTNAKEEVTEAASAVKEAASEIVDGFSKGIDAKLTELDKQGEALTQKAAQAKAEAKAEFQETIATLDKEKQALRQRLAEAKSATVDGADALKKDIEDTLLKLEEKYRKARDRFSA
jgi:exonuclease VII large subunit